VKGEAEAIYKAGESFYEAPNGVHLVSADTTIDKTPMHDTPLGVAVPETKSPRR
jgi:quercetin dioxygenase-like cupin family protein